MGGANATEHLAHSTTTCKEQLHAHQSVAPATQKRPRLRGVQARTRSAHSLSALRLPRQSHRGFTVAKRALLTPRQSHRSTATSKPRRRHSYAWTPSYRMHAHGLFMRCVQSWRGYLWRSRMNVTSMHARPLRNLRLSYELAPAAHIAWLKTLRSATFGCLSQQLNNEYSYRFSCGLAAPGLTYCQIRWLTREQPNRTIFFCPHRVGPMVVTGSMNHSRG